MNVGIDYYDYECMGCTAEGCSGHITDVPMYVHVEEFGLTLEGFAQGDWPFEECGSNRMFQLDENGRSLPPLSNAEAEAEEKQCKLKTKENESKWKALVPKIVERLSVSEEDWKHMQRLLKTEKELTKWVLDSNPEKKD